MADYRQPLRLTRAGVWQRGPVSFPLRAGHPNPWQESQEEGCPVGTPSQYTEQFRKDAVALVRSSDSPLRQIARDLGVNHKTLRGWVRAAERREAGGRAAEPELTLTEREEPRKLRVRELEKDILRKAAQYFAKEMGHSTFAFYAAASAHARWTWRISALVG